MVSIFLGLEGSKSTIPRERTTFLDKVDYSSRKDNIPRERTTFAHTSPTGIQDHLGPRTTWAQGSTGIQDHLGPRTTWDQGPHGTKDHLEPMTAWDQGQLETKALLKSRPSIVMG